MIQEITPKRLQERLNNGEDIQVVDVREDWELDISSLDFAEQIVMSDIPRRAQNEIAKDKPVVFVCRSGGRSMQVAHFLAMNGWPRENMINLKGGILAWAKDVDPSLPEHY